MLLGPYSNPIELSAGASWSEALENSDDVKFLPFSFILVKNNSTSCVTLTLNGRDIGSIGAGSYASVSNIDARSFIVKNSGGIAISAGNIAVILGTNGSSISGEVLGAQVNSALLTSLKSAVDNGNTTAQQSKDLLTALQSLQTTNNALATAIKTASEDGNITADEAKTILDLIKSSNIEVESNTGWQENTPFSYSIAVGEDHVCLIPDGAVTNADFMDVVLTSMSYYNNNPNVVWCGSQTLQNIPLVNPYSSVWSLPPVSYGYHRVNNRYARVISAYPVTTVMGSSAAIVTGGASSKSGDVVTIPADGGNNIVYTDVLGLAPGDIFKFTTGILSMSGALLYNIWSGTSTNPHTTLVNADALTTGNQYSAIAGVQTAHDRLRCYVFDNGANSGTFDRIIYQKRLKVSEKPTLTVSGSKYS